MIRVIVVIEGTISQIGEDKKREADNDIGWECKSDPSCKDLLPQGPLGEPWDMKSAFICEYTISDI